MSKNSINCKFLGIILTFALLMSLFSGIAAAEEDLMLEEDLVLLEEPEFSQDLPEEPVPEEIVPETEKVESSSNANLNEMDLYDNSYAPVLSKDLSEETVNYFLTQSSGALSVEVDKDSLIGTGYLTYLWQASSNGQSNWQNLSEDLEDNASWQPDTDQLGTTYYRVKVTYHYQVNTTPIVPFEGGTASTYSKVTPVAVSGINLDFGGLVMLEEVSGHNSSGLPYGSTFQGKLQGKGVYQVPASSGALKIEGTYGDLQYNPANGEFTITDIQSNLVIGAKAIHPKDGVDSVTASIMVSFNGENKILLPKELTVTKGLAAQYGYSGVSASDHNEIPVDAPTYFDFLVALHHELYGAAFDNNPTDYLYLDTESSSMHLLDRVFGLDKGSYSIMLVNDDFAGDGFDVNYAVDVNRLADGDLLNFMFYGDLVMWSDTYSYFSQSLYEVEPGKNITLELKSNNWGSISAVPGAKLYYVTPEGDYGTLDEEVGISTDDSGQATLNFDRTGTYLISAQGTFDSGWGEGPISYPYAQVIVSLSDSEMVLQAYYMVRNLDGETINIAKSEDKNAQIAKYLENLFVDTNVEGVKASVSYNEEKNKYAVRLSKGTSYNNFSISLTVNEVDKFNVEYVFKHYDSSTPSESQQGIDFDKSTLPDEVLAGQDLTAGFAAAAAAESTWTPACLVLPTLTVTMNGKTVDPSLYSFSNGIFEMNSENITGDLVINVCTAYKGDVDLNGKVNLSDVMKDLQHHLKTVLITNPDQFADGDVKSPYQVINLTDVMGILQHHLKTVILD